MFMPQICIGERLIGADAPVYFIADIAANHDGDLERAKALIHLAAQAGADAAKFQHFRANHIVSDYGFSHLTGDLSHQAKWKKSVFEVYQGASVPWEWTGELKRTCDEAGIAFFSSPYDFEAVDMLDAHVPAHKIGSGDITWIEILEHIAGKGKPVLLATGAADLGDVQRAVRAIRALNSQLLLMQCNTNYTASADNYRFLQLNALKTFAALYPDVVLGLSDHTLNATSVLGAVALGARAIEKHFTDDTTREGPDHGFSINDVHWREMVERTRELEMALGDADKRVQPNEAQTVILQRRCARASRDLKAGQTVKRADIEMLRPAPTDGISPYDVAQIVGKTLRRELPFGAPIKWTDLGLDSS